MWNGMTVTVVFPCYNEESGIVDAIEGFLRGGYIDEVVVVDNNSRDRSAERVAPTRARLVQETRQGYGFALRRGLREASGDLIILAEPDGTFDGKDVIKLLAYSDDFDCVLGTRTTREMIWDGANMGLFLRYGNLVVAKLLEVLFGSSSLSDCGCTMRLIHKRAARPLLDRFSVGGSHFLPEMVILCLLSGCSVVEVPVNYRSRQGTSKITGSFRNTWRVALRMIQIIVSYRMAAWFGRIPPFAKP
jgi:glycosyltransferase involved in cell wall biosynthesis